MTDALIRATSILSVRNQLTEEPEQPEEPKLNKVDEIWGEILEPTDLSEFVRKDSDFTVGGGGFGDIFRGTWYPNTRKNSIKRMWRTLSQPSLDKPVPVSIKVVRQVLAEGPEQEDAKKVRESMRL
jgi:hypothetical protein